jgi:hypothetical protein
MVLGGFFSNLALVQQKWISTVLKEYSLMTVSINRDNYLTKDEIKTYLMDMLSQRMPGDPHGDEIYRRRLEYQQVNRRKN